MLEKYGIAVLLISSLSGSIKGQSIDAQLQNINNQLSSGKTTISNILRDSSLLSLHALPQFREIIKSNAKAEIIQLSADSEPGTRITVRGTVLDSLGAPLTNTLIYVYQTSARGWYSDTAAHILQYEGDRRHARLFGYLKTDKKGKFAFLTIKPQGYPNSSLPAHIHIEISISNKPAFITELQFDDDPRLVGDIRTRSLREHFLISKNTGTPKDPIYVFELKTRR